MTHGRRRTRSAQPVKASYVGQEADDRRRIAGIFGQIARSISSREWRPVRGAGAHRRKNHKNGVVNPMHQIRKDIVRVLTTESEARIPRRRRPAQAHRCSLVSDGRRASSWPSFDPRSSYGKACGLSRRRSTRRMSAMSKRGRAQDRRLRATPGSARSTSAGLALTGHL